ncbi:sulfatase-like hydrolase/transferase [Lichenihabitans sp. Uapishka_5]|uniref:sulfatase-like hydrolase/transferase n=1 Tax=Lichenihabitans sp. Uapishka_5 TaxID=3037302 RepID=UPI0029E80377|nr:sulfatase-like hydrolase/transferase [Lichenihabitans sp. Uapishka_5]MDX7953247.1 sulfatase-like hydrolase/transferase [Lichenihabitans sp. Uapishka_5]
MTRPSILLITADQWRGDHLGCAGHPFAVTPNLDALAREGTRFARHYGQAYPCAPARAGLVTGLYAHNHRVISNGTPLDARHPTLFTALRRAGYRPTLFGYTDTALDPRGRAPGDPDLGDYENVCPGLAVDTLLTERATPWLAHLAARGHAIADPDAGRDGIYARRPFGEPTAFAAEESETAFLTDRFLSWLSVAGAEPFCAHLSFIAPHPPFAAAAPWAGLIDPDAVTMPIGGGAVEAGQHPLLAALLARTNMAGFAPGLAGLAAHADARTIRTVRATYAGLAAEVDHNIGRIVAALKAAGRWDSTVLVFTGDHGEQLFDHGLLGKTGYFDQSAHVPLILRDPRPEADLGRNRTVAQFTESIDVMPTVLALAGLDRLDNADGESLLPFCRGETPPGWRDEAHWAFDFRDPRGRHFETLFGLPSERCNLQVLRTDRLKYVHFAGQPPVLFDLHDDPDETRNCAADPGARALLLEGLHRMMTWRLGHEDRALTRFVCRGGTMTEHAR